ncbi:hypothetical protein HOU02_gp130 [Caulobacter phage CcrBL9]|uniref:Uncharacterized protein n=1 Tax=Caulobacter phage CcrBL9 TaxID=2283270 RepID=A0A385EB98_9CAUD|nr:hypothetical protein HOU02_gp130 [Caulobacter phage CcrBL9]AXQ69154.1 hypothetical protein CcrBL9_gp130 [Caulobacter phage CcrBL9]
MATLISRISDLAVAIRTKINAMMPRLLPSGGIAGQKLVKTSSSDYAVGWGERSVVFTGTTDANGLATITFTPAFTTAPYVSGQVDQASTANPVRMATVQVLDRTATGCKIKTMRHAVTAVLIGGNIPGAEAMPSAAYILRVIGT